MLASRESFYLILAYLNLKLYGREFQILVDFVKDYYDRDEHAKLVDRTLLVELISGSTNNDKHVARFLGIIDEAYSLDTSDTNVRQVILQLKQRELGQELAMAIANEKDHTKLLEDYSDILKFTDLDAMTEKGIEVYDSSSMEEMIAHQIDDHTRLKVYPLSLNARLDGGLRGTDHMTVFARPEQGKTAFVLTLAGGFAKQGARGIVFNNEESIRRLYMRQISNLTGLTVAQIKADPAAAAESAKDNGFDNIMFVSLSPGTPAQIEAYVKKYEPVWFVVDQLRNLFIKSESRTNQLEAAATAIRNIGKKYNAIAVSITQAGDSAEGKAVLDMGDVDYSNTGIPAQCDVLLGIGSTSEQHQLNLRVFSLSKNKISGNHDSFPVKMNPLISKYVSIQEPSRDRPQGVS